MRGMRAWFAKLSKPVLVALGLLGLLVVAVAFVGVAKATDQPAFCRSCHEMTPYNDAWTRGPHKEVSCIECHVDSGEVARLAHKFVALKEVVAHVQGDTQFPRETPPAVPDRRCLSCHAKIEVEQARFDHALHADRGVCATCHATIGHDVTVTALQAARIYSGQVPVAPSVDAGTVAVVDGGQANLKGHVKVTCSRCHIMAKTPCSACHKPKHEPRGACAACHAPGEEFVFAHPKKRADCETCHKPPANHFGSACASCHSPGRAWKSATFRHPGIRGGEHSYRSFPCVNCHPGGFASATCAKCHDSASGPRDD